MKHFIGFLTAIPIMFASLAAEARNFYQAELEIEIFYSSFTERHWAEQFGHLRFSDDGKFVHAFIENDTTKPTRIDLEFSYFSWSETYKQVSHSYIVTPDNATEALFLAILKPNDPYRAKIAKLLERYKTKQILETKLYYPNSDWRGFQFHDDVTEESLHIYYKIQAKLVPSGGTP